MGVEGLNSNLYFAQAQTLAVQNAQAQSKEKTEKARDVESKKRTIPKNAPFFCENALTAGAKYGLICTAVLS